MSYRKINDTWYLVINTTGQIFTGATREEAHQKYLESLQD